MIPWTWRIRTEAWAVNGAADSCGWFPVQLADWTALSTWRERSAADDDVCSTGTRPGRPRTTGRASRRWFRWPGNPYSAIRSSLNPWTHPDPVRGAISHSRTLCRSDLEFQGKKKCVKLVRIDSSLNNWTNLLLAAHRSDKNIRAAISLKLSFVKWRHLLSILPTNLQSNQIAPKRLLTVCSKSCRVTVTHSFQFAIISELYSP